jgi:hypothetical protein
MRTRLSPSFLPWKLSLLAALLVLLAAGNTWAMSPFRNFTIAPRQETFVPVSGGTTVPAVQANEAVSGAIPLGFDFKFDGSSQNTIYASSNGFLAFSANIVADPTNELGNIEYDNERLLAPLWDDLDGTGGTASYTTTGSAPNRVFTFEWRNWRWNPDTTGATITFQARLYEGSNRIEYAYNTSGNHPLPSDGASIGIASLGGFAALTNTSATPALDFDVAHDDLTSPLANGQVYALIPPTPPANDECANATLITVAPANDVCANALNTTNSRATVSGSTIPNSCLSGPDTWYRFVAPASGNVRVKMTASGGNLEVFSGSCGSLSSVDCNGNGNQNGNIISGLTPGAIHYLRVEVNNSDIDVPYTICVSNVEAAPAQPLANDDCVAALTLPVGSSCNPTTASLVGATPSASLGNPSCDSHTSPDDVWFRVVVPATGTIRVSASQGPAVDGASAIAMSVYSGSCGSLAEQTCSTYNGSAFYGNAVLNNRTPGEVLYVRVWNYFGGSGSFAICATDNDLNDLVVNSLNRYVRGSYRNVTVTGTGSAELSGDLSVSGTLLVQNGGELKTQEYHVLGAGSFNLAAGASLSLKNSAGISTSGATGAVQVTGTRSFSNDASYTYRVTPGSVTGSGLPGTVRNLFVNTDVDFNFDAFQFPGPGDLTLSNPLSVRQRVQLRRNLLTSPTNLLTLLSTPTQPTAIIYNDSDGFVGSIAEVSGPVRVQRAIDPSRNPGVGYRHYSAPVTGSTVADLQTAGFTPAVNPAYNLSATPGSVTPFPTVFGYDESRVATSPATNFSAFDKGWVSPSSSADPLAVGHGYTVNIAASQVVDFVGSANNGTQSVNLSRSAGTEAGWHLLGNPYPAAIDWSRATIPTGLSAAMYVYESTGQYAGTFRTYINGIGNPEIPTAQGFFVRQVGAPGSSVGFDFDNSLRETEYQAGPTFRRTAPERRPLVQLSLRGSAATALADQTTVYFAEDATAAVDNGSDAFKLRNPGGQAPSLFSLAANAELAINGLTLPTSASTLTVPLGLAVPAAGTYTLTADQLRNLAPAGLSNVELLDRRNGQRTSLSAAGASYTFQLGATELNSLGRLALVFNAAATPLATAGSLAQQLSLYPNPAHGRFTLSVPALPGTSAVRASLRNSLGQEVLPARLLPLTAAGAVADFDTHTLAPGVYLLQLSAEGLAPVSKRVVVE